MVCGKRYDTVVAGYTCLDLTPEFSESESLSIQELFKPGRLTELEGISFIPGGVVPNTGMAMKRFNKKVFLNGLVGDDFIGATLIKWLGQYGLSEGIQITEEESSAFSIVIAPPGHDRSFLESIGCNKVFGTDHINYEAVANCKIFHFGYPPLLKQFYCDEGNKLAGMFSKIENMGVTTSLDFSLPDPNSESGRIEWSKVLERVLPSVDICTPSLEEALFILMPDQYVKLQSAPGSGDLIDRVPDSMILEIGRELVSLGAKIVLIKAAHRGAYLYTGDIVSVNHKLGNILDKGRWNNCELWCPAYPADQAKIKNATGAGDTAIAAFLTAILNGNDPDRALQYATLAGRNNLYCNNLYEELDSWEKITEELNNR
ncbi:MAG: carbohydrate kinase family protein [Bacteroidota bacterium]